MSYWYTTLYRACIYAGIISFIVGFFTESTTSLGAYISGYSMLSLGVMMILVIMFSNILKLNQNEPFIKIMSSIINTTGNFILILAVISFILYLLINYKENIVAGRVSPSYNSFSNIIVMLLVVQFYLINSNVNTERFETTGKMSNVVSSMIYLLGLVTAICSIILYTTLKYFSTDGFTLMRG